MAFKQSLPFHVEPELKGTDNLLVEKKKIPGYTGFDFLTLDVVKNLKRHTQQFPLEGGWVGLWVVRGWRIHKN